MRDVIAVAIFVMGVFGVGLVADVTHDMRYAKAATAFAAPPCTPIASTGNIVISRCEDEETGQVLYVNNIGMMVLGE